LLAHCARPESGNFDEALFHAVQHALDAIDLEHDTTSGTREYYEWLKAAIYQLRRPPVPWPLWISASRKSARKKSDAIAARVREAASAYERHPDFHADVRRYIESCYTVAG